MPGVCWVLFIAPIRANTTFERGGDVMSSKFKTIDYIVCGNNL
jgi:hypothetical protein